jgi:hypothetical protein
VSMMPYKPLPDFVSAVRRDVLRIASARETIEANGGVESILQSLSAGTKMVFIAKKIGVTIAQINAYLRAACDPTDLEAAMASQIRSRVEILDDEAGDIEDLKKRFDAKKEILFWQADKETEKYKAKQLDVQRGGVTINIDWSQFDAKPPEVLIDGNL